MIAFTNIGKIGRLGNQMFQYAAAFAIAKEKKYILGMPYNNRSEDEHQDFCMRDCFPYLSATNCHGKVFKNKFNEIGFGFDANINQIEDDTDLYGYFQSPKYFDRYKSEIKKEFTFRYEIIAKAKNIKLNFQQETIALHLRLGDYTWKTHYHPICGVEYYRHALLKIPDIKNKQILLFSDDIVAAQKLLINFDTNPIITNNKYVDLCIMTMCDYHVIANSTFSWWAAYLSRSKMIFAPKNWFGKNSDAPQDWKDIYCDGWLII